MCAPPCRDDRRPRLLVVDDEALLAEAVGMAFDSDGWETRTAGRGREAALSARDFSPDVIVLDIMLPDIDGLEVLERVRAFEPDTRVLFLTARDAQADLLAGLRAGGDDYVTKPFSIDELVARARTLLRSSIRFADAPSPPLSFGELEIDERTRAVRRSGTPIELTSTEYELFRFFMKNPRRVISKDELLTAVWGYDFGATSNLVEMYVSYLRRKLGESGEPVIHTVRGVGYILKQESPEQPAARDDGR